jgi:hypothetical protein
MPGQRDRFIALLPPPGSLAQRRLGRRTFRYLLAGLFTIRRNAQVQLGCPDDVAHPDRVRRCLAQRLTDAGDRVTLIEVQRLGHVLATTNEKLSADHRTTMAADFPLSFYASQSM